MIEQLRPPRMITTGTNDQNLAELRKYIYNTVAALNVILLDIDRRLAAIEKGQADVNNKKS